MAQSLSIALNIDDHSTKTPAFGLDMYPRVDLIASAGSSEFWANYDTNNMGVFYFARHFSIEDTVTPDPTTDGIGGATQNWFHGTGKLNGDDDFEYWTTGGAGEFTRAKDSFGVKYDWCQQKNAVTSAWWATATTILHPNAPFRIMFCPYQPKDDSFTPEYRWYFGRNDVSTSPSSGSGWRYYLRFTDHSVELYRWDGSSYTRAAGGDILTGEFYNKRHTIDVMADRKNRMVIYNAQTFADGFYYRESSLMTSTECDAGNFEWMWLGNKPRFYGTGGSCLWLAGCSYASYASAELWGPMVYPEDMPNDWTYDHTKISTRNTSLVYPKTAANDTTGDDYGAALTPPGGAGHPWITKEDHSAFSDADTITSFRYKATAATSDRRYNPIIARTRIRFDPDYATVTQTEVDVSSTVQEFTEQNGSDLGATTFRFSMWDTSYDSDYPADSMFFERGGKMMIPVRWNVGGSVRGYGYIDRSELKWKKGTPPGSSTYGTMVYVGSGKDRWKVLDMTRLGNAPVLDGQPLTDALGIMLEAAGIDSSMYDMGSGYQDYVLPDAEGDNSPKFKLSPKQTVGDFLRHLIQNYEHIIARWEEDGKFHVRANPFWPSYDTTYDVTQNFYFETSRAPAMGYYTIRRDTFETWMDESKFYNAVRVVGWDVDRQRAIMTQDPAHYSPSWTDSSDQRYIGRLKPLNIIDTSLNSLTHVAWVQSVVFERVSQTPLYCRFVSKHEPTIYSNSQISLHRWSQSGEEVVSRWRIVGLTTAFGTQSDDCTYECQRVGWSLESRLF